MKKTIAILLVLVIGMVGVFADEPRENTHAATITLNTKIPVAFAVGVTEEALGEGSFSSLENFLTDTQATAAYQTVGDMYDFAGETAVPVAYLHAFNNTNAGATITVTGNDFKDSDAESTNTSSIPITLTISGLGQNNEISVSPATAGVTTIRDYAVGVQVSKADIDLATASDTYEATIIFGITSP